MVHVVSLVLELLRTSLHGLGVSGVVLSEVVVRNAVLMSVAELAAVVGIGVVEVVQEFGLGLGTSHEND